MLFWNCLLGLSVIGFINSAEIVPGSKTIESFNLEDNQIDKNGENVEVRLYYESLCYSCIEFYSGPLNKTVEKLAAYLDLKTYPYGNANMTENNGKTEIECQHGPWECHGNKLQACTIDMLKNITRYVFYNSCLMAERSSDGAAIKCGKSMGIDAKSIVECANSDRGEKLLEYYGKETQKDVPHKRGVPWILINGERYGDDFDNFTAAVCAALPHPPPQCY